MEEYELTEEVGRQVQGRYDSRVDLSLGGVTEITDEAMNPNKSFYQ